MPTVMRIDGLRVVIYPNDHSPGHVHVVGSDCEAVIQLHCPEGPVALRESYGFATPRLRHVMEVLDDALAELCTEWNRIHETDRR